MNVPHTETYRPNYHFSPQKGWMNDPNGPLYLNGTWHLFFQYYPCAPIHGPMYWGHATSCDLVCWEEKPIALCPEGAIQIFSGSAVVDYCNTSEFGDGETPPVVAIYTGHNTAETDPNAVENQCIAYSLDNCTTWTQYEGNPVLKNPGIPNFRDPKVSWDAERCQWSMVLAAGDRVRFYKSENCKDWECLTEFGADCGAHGGVWECPDLFWLPVKDEADGLDPEGVGGDCDCGCSCRERKWVLLVSVNPGGPNEGSATQYFVGEFDGTMFTLDETQPCNEVRWVDWGRDNYAGVLFNNVPCGRRVMIGWMSNWDYAADLPTGDDGWRGQMTIPRELFLTKTEAENYVLHSYPVSAIFEHCDPGSRLFRCGSVDSPNDEVPVICFSELDLECACLKLSLHNLGPGRTTFTARSGWGEELKWGIYNDTDADSAELFIDRSQAGLGDLPENFSVPVMTAPLAGGMRDSLRLCLLFDKTSIELFANYGERTLTSLFFPTAPFNRCCVSAETEGVTFSLEACELRLNNCEP